MGKIYDVGGTSSWLLLPVNDNAYQRVYITDISTRLLLSPEKRRNILKEEDRARGCVETFIVVHIYMSQFLGRQFLETIEFNSVSKNQRIPNSVSF